MRGKKAKAIRKVILPKGYNCNSTQYNMVSHPKFIHPLFGESHLSYRMQYITSGPRREYILAKKIYKATGVLPSVQNNVEPKES